MGTVVRNMVECVKLLVIVGTVAGWLFTWASAWNWVLSGVMVWGDGWAFVGMLFASPLAIGGFIPASVFLLNVWDEFFQSTHSSGSSDESPARLPVDLMPADEWVQLLRMRFRSLARLGFDQLDHDLEREIERLKGERR